jgi:hypothetical protein
MLRRVAEQLRDAGYSSAICRSKWTRSLDIPAGNGLLSRYSCWFLLLHHEIQTA